MSVVGQISWQSVLVEGQAVGRPGDRILLVRQASGVSQPGNRSQLGQETGYCWSGRQADGMPQLGRQEGRQVVTRPGDRILLVRLVSWWSQAWRQDVVARPGDRILLGRPVGWWSVLVGGQVVARPRQRLSWSRLQLHPKTGYCWYARWISGAGGQVVAGPGDSWFAQWAGGMSQFLYCCQVQGVGVLTRQEMA